MNDFKSESRNMHIIVMGVCGSGKTTVGQALSKKLGWSFADADEFHSKENKTKMSNSQPLTDEDRTPWLLSIHEHLSRLTTNGDHGIVACSALKRKYRSILTSGQNAIIHTTSENNQSSEGKNITEMSDVSELDTEMSDVSELDIQFVHLSGSRWILENRLSSRQGHFMPAALLQSQLDTLEPLYNDELGFSVDVNDTLDVQIQKIITQLRLHT